jgi:hypothetical protein
MTKPTGKPNGAPTKYNEDYCIDVVDYFRDSKGFPTLEDFAVNHCDVTPKTINNWMDSQPDFLRAVEKGKGIQKHRLIQGAFSGDYNSTFSIFFAKNNCGMKDKMENEISGLDSINIQIVKPRQKRGE